MAIKLTITDKDRGWNKIRQTAKEVGKGAAVYVGVFRDKAGGGDVRVDPVSGGTLTNLEIAIIQEFGTKRIPARSFVRSTFKQNVGKYFIKMKRLARSVADGEIKPRTSLNKLGKMIANDIKQRVLTGPYLKPPLSQITIDRKGHDRPLVDEKKMIEAVTWKTSLGRKPRKV